MIYYSQIELEKIIEHLYDRQVAVTCPEEVETNAAILETRRLMIQLQDANKKLLDRVICGKNQPNR